MGWYDDLYGLYQNQNNNNNNGNGSTNGRLYGVENPKGKPVDYNTGLGYTYSPYAGKNNDDGPKTYYGTSSASTGGYDPYSALMSYWEGLRHQANATWNKWLKQRQSENADYRRKVVDQANISKLQTAKGLRQTPNSGPKLSRYVQSNLGHLNTIAEAKREENKANQNDSITAEQGKLGLQTQIANLQSQWLPYLIQNGYTGSLNL